jgi:ABC-type transporter Mla MlaB component
VGHAPRPAAPDRTPGALRSAQPELRHRIRTFAARLAGPFPQGAKGTEAKVQTVNLSGILNGQAAAQFAQLIQIGMRTGALRIDLSRLRGVDNAGAELLLRAVRGLRKAKIKLSLAGAGHLAAVLGGVVTPGKAEQKPVWLLLLEVLQYTEQHDRFEELAVDYAMTFEESPPVVGAPSRAHRQPGVRGSWMQLSDVYRLDGEIVGPNTEVLRKITAFASGRTKVEVDCSQLRRMDFVSAGTLFNIVSQLHAQGGWWCSRASIPWLPP